MATFRVIAATLVALAPAAGFLPQPLAPRASPRRRSAVFASTAPPPRAGPSAPFNVSTAVFAAGFAFEAYNEPAEQDARWERGADGCDVAFMSEDFAREVYAGRLEVRLCEAKELTTDTDLAQSLMSGGQRDPYVIFAMNEENQEGPKEGAIGLGRAVVRARAPPRAHAHTRTHTHALSRAHDACFSVDLFLCFSISLLICFSVSLFRF